MIFRNTNRAASHQNQSHRHPRPQSHRLLAFYLSHHPPVILVSNADHLPCGAVRLAQRQLRTTGIKWGLTPGQRFQSKQRCFWHENYSSSVFATFVQVLNSLSMISVEAFFLLFVRFLEVRRPACHSWGIIDSLLIVRLMNQDGWLRLTELTMSCSDAGHPSRSVDW